MHVYDSVNVIFTVFICVYFITLFRHTDPLLEMRWTRKACISTREFTLQ